MNRRTFLERAGLVLGGLVLGSVPRASAAAASEKISVVDAAGRTVSVAIPVQRVVLMFDYEEFIAVGGSHAFDRVVGYSKTVWYDWRRSIWERYAAVIPNLAQLPDVGYTDDSTFSAEKVIALRPDVFITPRWEFTSMQQGASQIAAAGIPIVVIDYNAQQVPTHVASTLVMGQLLGTDARARQLAALYGAKVADVQARVARATTPRPKVYVELGQGGPSVYGNSYSDDLWGPLIETSGGINIAKGRVNDSPLSPEYILASNPDYIFITGSTWPNSPQAVEMGFGVSPALTNARLRAYLARPGWSGLSAVKNGRVYAIHHGIARTLFDYSGMQFFAKAMYPAQFTDIDPEASLRDYFSTWLPVRYDGTWMLQLQR